LYNPLKLSNTKRGGNTTFLMYRRGGKVPGLDKVTNKKQKEE